MQKKGEISEYREKLDKTLSSPELTDHESLKSLLRNQLCSSSECNENTLDKRTADVSKLLSMLRSVSMTDASSSSHGDWKIKQDLEDCRVMYRQGLEGSPFHTLLVEGYMDSPLEDCLCVSWETALYKNWWPQFAFPPFKILQGTCLHKVRTGEQVCLVRMKVPWPLSEREVIVHYFLFEYFKDGLVVVLLNSISDLDSIGVSAKDMAKKVIPEATSAVRIDLVGGFALQKVTSQRSFVRVIGELDIKLDLVPPSLMNFIARQIVGKGFKLYKKAAGSVAKLDEGFSRALAHPLYINIRQAMYSTNKATEEEQETENKHENDEYETVHCRRAILEIEEEKEEEYFEESVSSEERNVNGNIRRQFSISTEVEQALGTLDRAINMVRNITPVKEDEELPPNKAEDQRKQVSMLETFENVPQRSQSQYFSTSRVSVTQEGSYFSQEDNKREKETGDDHLNKERERHQMNKTKKLVASISTLLTRRTSHPSSSTLRCNPLATIASNSQTHLNPVKPLAVSIRRLQFSGRGFCSESSDKRSSSGCCWNCGFSSDKAAFLFCDSCRSIQPVDDSVDYFQIFGLEKKYELEGGSLEGKYKDWQKKLHPDLVHNKSQKERDYAADQSAKVTEACRTLTKRLSRAMYIMKLNDKNVNEEETVTDPTLLMEMMELREAIAEADDSKELNQIQSQVQENLKQWSDSFADNFESQRFDEAVNCIRRMTYYEKACEEIVKKL
uniref:Co-chaperone HscB C-terminal oligomerisation domain-containing protein n=1 Tax=Brassica oleracea TaxID=3712 RepID=A0A3P6A024_BRAOL|nr:unnamed protein product [Brassica oleracea]